MFKLNWPNLSSSSKEQDKELCVVCVCLCVLYMWDKEIMLIP